VFHEIGLFQIEADRMVSSDLGTGEQLLYALASINDAMGNAAQTCRTYSSVKVATAGCFIHRFGYMNNETVENQQIVSFEAWIEILAQTQRSTTCYLELKAFGDRWVLDRDIFENVADGREDVLSLPEIQFSTFSHFRESIGELVRELTGALPQLIA
jgi:hypothetical protein